MDLNELKKILDQSKQSVEECKKLAEERDDLHERIVLLKGQIENDLTQLHHLRRKKSEKAHALEQEIKKKTETSALLKQKIKKLDAYLDELGEEQDASLEELKSQILSQLKEKFPKFKDSFSKLEKKLHTAKARLDQLKEEENLLKPFCAALFAGKRAKEEKRGFWDFIFGRHPKILLSTAIHKAAEEAERIQRKISDKKFAAFFHSFLEEAHKKWNHPLYKEKFFVFYNKFSELMDSHSKELEDARHEVQKLEKEMDDLVESYCHSK